MSLKSADMSLIMSRTFSTLRVHSGLKEVQCGTNTGSSFGYEIRPQNFNLVPREPELGSSLWYNAHITGRASSLCLVTD